jgi:hypothetical protein
LQFSPVREASESPERILAGVARILASRHPEVVEKLLVEHVADASGRCAACRSTSTGSPVWPCALRNVAEQARWLIDGR